MAAPIKLKKIDKKSDDTVVKLTQEQKAVVAYIAKRLTVAQREVQRWQMEQQRSIQEFAIDLCLDLREDWKYNDGQFIKMGFEEKSDAKGE